MQPGSLDIAHTQPQQLPGTQACHDGHAVGVNIIIRHDFSTDHTGVCGEQHAQCFGLQDLLALVSRAFRYR